MQNPILSGFYPDPSVCRVGDTFYLATSTFAYFPGVPIFASKNLASWHQIGNVLERPEQLPLGNARVSQGIFAPTIRHHNGVYYMITTNVSHRGNFVVTATNPAGPWSEPHFIAGAKGIDPSLFFEGDKCWYHGTCERSEGGAYYGDNEIYLQELDLREMKLVGERHVIYHCALKNAVWPEAPHIYKHGEFYYLLLSEGGTGDNHAMTVARSKTLTGYYEGNPKNPILTHRHLGREYPICNVGHGDFVDDPHGNWWVVLLASRHTNGHSILGRETWIARVEWEHGWPVVNVGSGIVGCDLPHGLPLAAADGGFAAPPAGPAGLPVDVMHLRNPNFGDYTVLDGEGLCVRLVARNEKITSLDCVSYAGVRLTSRHASATCKMQFSPAKAEAAGLVAFQSEKFHYQFLKAHETMCVVKVADGEETLLANAPAPAGTVWLRINVDDLQITFEFSADGQDYVDLCSADAGLLSTKTAGGFVGVTIGMYATGHGTNADFYDFKCEPM